MHLHLTRLYLLTGILKEMLRRNFLNEITQGDEQDLNQLWQLRQLHEMTLLFTLNNVLCCASDQRVSKSSTRKVIFVLSSFKRRLVCVKSPRNCVAYTQETGFTATQTTKQKGSRRMGHPEEYVTDGHIRLSFPPPALL
jgi:hypothetical protein